MKRTVGRKLMMVSTLLLSVALARPGVAGRDIEGTYEGELGTLKVSRRDARVVIELSGGSPPNTIEVANCTIRAEGKLEQSRFSGRFVALENDQMAYSEERASSEKRKLEVVFGPHDARVTAVDVFGYCGVGARFVGTFKKRR
jgi:hypothetical protein